MGLCGATISGCGCGLSPGAGIEVSGSGGPGDPWVVGVPDAVADLLNFLSNNVYQHGSTVVTLAGSPLTATVNFPVAFPSTPRTILVTNGDLAAQQAVLGVNHSSKTASSFVVRAHSGTGAAANVRVNWIAIL